MCSARLRLLVLDVFVKFLVSACVSAGYFGAKSPCLVFLSSTGSGLSILGTSESDFKVCLLFPWVPVVAWTLLLDFCSFFLHRRLHMNPACRVHPTESFQA